LGNKVYQEAFDEGLKGNSKELPDGSRLGADASSVEANAVKGASCNREKLPGGLRGCKEEPSKAELEN
jgi:hypothetical protein